MNNLAFSKIWIIVILAVLIAGGFFAWQYFGTSEKEINDETTGWKTYRNEKYGFEIEYPDSGAWETKISTVAGDPAGDPVVIIKNSESYSYFTITKRKNDNSLTLKEWLDSLAVSTGQNFKNFKKVFIGGIEAYGDPSSQYKSIIIANQQKEVFTLFSFSNLSEDDFVFEQMLSTFRFIEVDETAEWKTYRNEEYGYEVRYPDQLISSHIYNNITAFYKIGEEPWWQVGGLYEEIFSVQVSSSLKELAGSEAYPSLKEWLDHMSSIYKFKIEPVDIGKMNYKGFFGYYEEKPSPQSFIPGIFLQENNAIYMIHGVFIIEGKRITGSEQLFSFTPISNQILSTFRFLE